MEFFLIDKSRRFTYADLVDAINRKQEYYLLFKNKDLFPYFVNLLSALASNQPLVLLDADLNLDEIEDVKERDVNVAFPLEPCHYNSAEEIVKAILHSSSEITIFTSGTTGQPKKVLHTISSLTRFLRTGNCYEEQTWAYAYNPTHMAGLQVFFQAFANGNTLINVFNFSRSEIYRLIHEFQVTHISATPTFYRLLLPCESAYPSVVRVTLGGERSESQLYDSIKKIFPMAKINNIYASTEAGSLFVAQGDCFRIPEAIRNKIRVEEDELFIHKSLLGKSEHFQLIGDYYPSGDLVEWQDDERNTFKFKSRKNELINIGGYKVNPGEVESALLSIAGISQVRVYGRSNSVLGNILCAEVRLEPSSVLEEVEIRNQLKDRLQDFKIPSYFKFVETLSLTRTGKLKRL